MVVERELNEVHVGEWHSRANIRACYRAPYLGALFDPWFILPDAAPALRSLHAFGK